MNKYLFVCVCVCKKNVQKGMYAFFFSNFLFTNKGIYSQWNELVR